MINIKRFKALFMAGVLTVGMCAGSMSAFANEPATEVQGAGEATIVKTLEMAEGITVPNAAFSFTVTPVTVDAPALSVKDIVYTSATDKGELEGDKYAIDLRSSLGLDTANFPHAGVYEYTITEVADTYLEAANEEVVYSTEEYKLLVYVANDGEGGLEVVSVTAEDNTGVKQAKINFTNVYRKDAALTISKVTEGEYADKTKEFDFTITLTRAATEDSSEMTVNAKLGDQVVPVTYGVPYSFKLADGDSLVFDSLPAGTRYTVTEVGVEDGYTPSYVLTENGQEKPSVKGAEADDLAVENALVGENSNSVVFTNTEGSIVVTGVIMNNLPFIILIAVAVAGIAGYVAVRRKIAR